MVGEFYRSNVYLDLCWHLISSASIICVNSRGWRNLPYFKGDWYINIGKFFFSNLSHSTIITVQFIFPVSLQAPGVHINTLLDFQTLLYLLNKCVDKNQNHLTPKDYLKG